MKIFHNTPVLYFPAILFENWGNKCMNKLGHIIIFIGFILERRLSI